MNSCSEFNISGKFVTRQIIASSIPYDVQLACVYPSLICGVDT